VPVRCPPPLDLSIIVATPSTKIIAAVPLKPSSGIVFVNPPFVSPNGKRLGSVDSEKVERRIASPDTQFSILEPDLRKLFDTIGHVLPTKNSQAKHLLGCELRVEVRVEILPRRLA